jgi:hypothetical protein
MEGVWDNIIQLLFDFVLAIGVLVLGCNFSKVHKLHQKVKVET